MRSLAVVAAVLSVVAAVDCKGEPPPPPLVTVPAATYDGIHIPTTSANLLPPLPRDAPVVKLDGDAIYVGTQKAITLVDGGMPESTYDDDGALVHQLALAIGRSRAFVVVADANTRYGLLYELGMMAARAEYETAWVAVARGSECRAVRVSFPSRHTAVDHIGDAGMDEAAPLWPVVELAGDQISLYSMAGDEGTPDKPLIRLPRDASGSFDFQLLGGAAAGMVARHYVGKPRSPASLRIGVLPDHDVPLQTVVETVIAVSVAPPGKVRFPDVLLTTSIR